MLIPKRDILMHLKIVLLFLHFVHYKAYEIIFNLLHANPIAA